MLRDLQVAFFNIIHLACGLFVFAIGIGKTAIVNQVAQLLGHNVERINFSNSSTLDQLIGCIIPRCVDGVRVVFSLLL